MKQQDTTQQSYIDRIVNAASQLPGNMPSWIKDMRRQSLTHFTQLGLPTTRNENWKYTNVSAIERHGFLPLANGHGDVPVAQVESLVFDGLQSHRLVFVDGLYVPELSDTAAFPSGVTAGSLATALTDTPETVRPYLGQQVPTDRHSFATLNSAFLVDGAYIHLAQDAVSDKPIHLIYITTESSDTVLVQPRNLVIAEANSQVTVIEHYAALGETRYFTNTLTEVNTQRNAVVEHYRVQQESSKAYHIGGLYVRQQCDSRFTSHAIDLGGLLVRNDVCSTLADEGAECNLNGLYLVAGRQHVDNHTQIDHAKPNGTSREFYKGILDDRARAVFNGKVIVHQDAQHSDAQQMNNNLLLSRDAEVDTKPELEIYADDVKCSHGATVGQLDPEALFYLRSRAVDEITARDLLTYAFANDVLHRFLLTPIRQHLENRLTSRLLHGRSIKELELI